MKHLIIAAHEEYADFSSYLLSWSWRRFEDKSLETLRRTYEIRAAMAISSISAHLRSTIHIDWTDATDTQHNCPQLATPLDRNSQRPSLACGGTWSAVCILA